MQVLAAVDEGWSHVQTQFNSFFLASALAVYVHAICHSLVVANHYYSAFDLQLQPGTGSVSIKVPHCHPYQVMMS